MFRLARPRNGACCPRRWYRRTEKARRLRSDSQPNGTKWSLPAKQAGEHSRKAPEYLKKLGVLNLHLSNDINTLHAGGAGSLERTRLPPNSLLNREKTGNFSRISPESPIYMV